MRFDVVHQVGVLVECFPAPLPSAVVYSGHCDCGGVETLCGRLFEHLGSREGAKHVWPTNRLRRLLPNQVTVDETFTVGSCGVLVRMAISS